MTSNRIAWLDAGDPPDAFPPIEQALREPDGLLAAGGDLGVPRLLAAYRRGIFPWYDDGQPILWWSPDPRCVFLPGSFHLSRSLRRDARRSDGVIRLNTAFDRVIRACAAPRASQDGTWITEDMAQAYESLHAAGWAHSVEVWEEDELIGGLYGLAIGRAFFGESMFSRRSNASKFTLLYLSGLLDAGEFGLLDCQIQSPHLMSLGARMIPRQEFSMRLESLCNPPSHFVFRDGPPLAIADLAAENRA